MKLKVGNIYIEDIIFDEELKIINKTLHINPSDLITFLKQDKNIEEATVNLAKPNEKIRIIPVKDVIEPRIRINSSLSNFPGVSGPIGQTGNGEINILKNTAIVTIGDIVGFQEGIIDMWGEGAKWTPFSKTLNIVVDVKPIKGLPPHLHEQTVRLAGLKASEFIGKAGANISPDEIITYSTDSMSEEILNNPALPKVIYVEMLISQGLLHDTYIYGVNSQDILPTLIHPNEELDGAVISGNCVAACDKITTFQHQNNSMIIDLYNRHGKDLNFLGVVLTPELTTLEGKLRTADFTAKLCQMIGAEGVIITEEGYGNPDSDLLMICKRLEASNIKTVLITDECSGWDGMSQPLADTVPEAIAVISGGNVSHLINLPPADIILGNSQAIATLAGGWEGSLAEDGSITCELNAIIGATSEIGYHYCTTKEY